MLNLDYLNKHFLYDPKTGLIIRKISTTVRYPIGSVPGTLSTNGYWQLSIKSKAYGAHRIAWMMYYKINLYSELPKVLDHKDRNPLNNKINNLREATHSDNSHNMSMLKRNKTGYRGITFAKGSWQAVVSSNNKQCYLGKYSTAEEAALAHDKKALELHKEFAVLNFNKDYVLTCLHPKKHIVPKRKGCTSIYFGVRKNPEINNRGNIRKKRWVAIIYMEGKIHQIGTFCTEIEAAKAYNLEATEIFGDKAKLNILID